MSVLKRNVVRKEELHSLLSTEHAITEKYANSIWKNKWIHHAPAVQSNQLALLKRSIKTEAVNTP